MKFTAEMLTEMRERLEALPVGSTRRDIENVMIDVVRRVESARFAEQLIVEIDPADSNRINVLLPVDFFKQ